jgi:hypothetical protein
MMKNSMNKHAFRKINTKYKYFHDDFFRQKKPE